MILHPAQGSAGDLEPPAPLQSGNAVSRGGQNTPGLAPGLACLAVRTDTTDRQATGTTDLHFLPGLGSEVGAHTRGLVPSEASLRGLWALSSPRLLTRSFLRVCVCVSQSPVLVKTLSHWIRARKGGSLSSNLLKCPSSKCSRSLRARAPVGGLWRPRPAAPAWALPPALASPASLSPQVAPVPSWYLCAPTRVPPAPHSGASGEHSLGSTWHQAPGGSTCSGSHWWLRVQPCAAAAHPGLPSADSPPPPTGPHDPCPCLGSLGRARYPPRLS